MQGLQYTSNLNFIQYIRVLQLSLADQLDNETYTPWNMNPTLVAPHAITLFVQKNTQTYLDFPR